MSRLLAAALTVALTAVGVTATAQPAAAAVTVTVDALSISPAAPAIGQSVTATARVRASGSVAVQALTIAVRSADGTIVDFPGAIATTLTTTARTFQPEARTFPAGSYTYFVAYEVNNRWTNLSPQQTFTVGVGSNPLTFSQDFDGPAGAGPNTGLSQPVWFTDPCWVDGCTGTLAQYKDDHATLDGQGHLVLTADKAVDAGARCGDVACKYASARLSMLDWEENGGLPYWSQAGGHFEARMKAPLGKGLWPAFWTIGANNDAAGWPVCGEIDIMETLGDAPTIVEQHAHGGTEDINFGNNPALPAGQTIAGWHTYAIDWNAGANGYVKWSVDGVVTTTLTAATAGTAWGESFRNPHALILNLAVGGEWPGAPDANTVFPAQLQVDWIRVNQQPMR
jgi:beta-glucanase (GH16 family)